uniref:peptide-methionine (S)-S-oxide reductase n=1 Tax=Picea sitchensis TaxID=3332 RepID=A9P120_PICSI|nr:unknown [Picea sitchensis]
MSSALQAGSLVTASYLFLATTQFRNSPKKSLHPLLSVVSADNWHPLKSYNNSPFSTRRRISTVSPVNNLMDGWLSKLGFGGRVASRSSGAIDTEGASIAQGPDNDLPGPGQQFAQFGAGCFWGVELAFQRVPGVTKTEVGYSQGLMHKPTYEDVCSGTTMHSEVVRVQYDPKECSYHSLLDVFWARHDPTTLNRQAGKFYIS